MMAKVRHPHVVQIYDTGAWEDRAFLTMELVEGTSLRTWLASKPRAPLDIFDVLIQIGRGLIAVHDAGLTHGDVKPDNVRVTPGGVARVLDFGLSIDHSDTRSSQPSGTPAYLAPEVFEGARPSQASDQYAFAVLAYEAWSGRRPFASRPWVMQVIEPRPPAWTGFSTGLRAVLGRALQPRPEQRFESMAACVAAMEEIR